VLVTGFAQTSGLQLVGLVVYHQLFGIVVWRRRLQNVLMSGFVQISGRQLVGLVVYHQPFSVVVTVAIPFP